MCSSDCRATARRHAGGFRGTPSVSDTAAAPWFSAWMNRSLGVIRSTSGHSRPAQIAWRTNRIHRASVPSSACWPGSGAAGKDGLWFDRFWVPGSKRSPGSLRECCAPGHSRSKIALFFLPASPGARSAANRAARACGVAWIFPPSISRSTGGAASSSKGRVWSSPSF